MAAKTDSGSADPTLALIDTINQNIQNFQNTNDDTARQKVVAAASRLIVQLENPFEQMTRVGWGEPSRTAALRTAFELGLFKKLGPKPASVPELAEGTGAEPELVARALKHIASYGFVNEVGKDTYTGTPFSMATNDPTIAAGLVYSFEMMIPSFHRLPDYLAKTNYRVPHNANDGPVQLGLNTEKSFFEYLQGDARLGDAFNKFMAAYAKARPSWVNFYPWDQRLIEGFNKEAGAPLVVDVGGGTGHDITALYQKLQGPVGALILEDKTQVIAQCKSSGLPSDITPIAHDFFTPQPPAAKGARAFFLRQVLHDWPDEQCREILGHIKEAMIPGYSRLLINEHVLPDTGASWQQTSLDWTMMAMLVSRERTESQWRSLLDSVGLKTVGIWERDAAGEKVIEAVRE